MEDALIQIFTIILTLILGNLSKKSNFINNNLIPFQNFGIGLIIAIVHYCFTKDFNGAIALSGLLAGGTYDVVHGSIKFKKEQDEEEQDTFNEDDLESIDTESEEE